MTLIQAFILGIVQGATEFIPVSSSGHLVIVPHLLGWQIPHDQAFVFDVWVQMGTLLAVILYFWKDIWAITIITLTSLWHPNRFSQPEVRLGVYLLVATIPAALIGFFFKDTIEAAFASPQATAAFFLLTAALLWMAERLRTGSILLEQIEWKDALVIGLFQILALFPGVSRSGSTIAGGMARKLDRRSAARFSFLMAVPVMVGAGLFTILDFIQLPDPAQFVMPMMVGFFTSAVVGYLSIRWLLNYLSNHSLSAFAVYLVILSGVSFILG